MNAWFCAKLIKMVPHTVQELPRIFIPATASGSGAPHPENRSSSSDFLFPGRDYFQNDGHFIPQYDFIFDGDDRRVVDHVLHFEHLHEKFPQLMMAYNLSSIHLSSLNHFQRAADGESKENRNNLKIVLLCQENKNQRYQGPN